MNNKLRRNSSAFSLMAWVSFGFFCVLILIGLYTLKEPLMVKGYYLMGFVGLISSSFTVAKVVRDNQEDTELFMKFLSERDEVSNK